MLSREEVYFLLNAERRYQDIQYDPNVELAPNITRGDFDLEPTPGIVLLDLYVQKAKSKWARQGVTGNLQSLQHVAKVAAIAIKILERATGSEKLLTTGLR